MLCIPDSLRVDVIKGDGSISEYKVTRLGNLMVTNGHFRDMLCEI